jgi:UDP-2,3-diacylglucosamine pyrophosphatase LpxH
MTERGLFYPDGSFKSQAEIRRGLSSTPQIIKPEPLQPTTFDEELQRMKELQKQREPLQIWKDEVDIQVDTGRLPYFFLMPLSDLHIGSEHTDYHQLEKYLKVIDRYPIYTVPLGDLGDFFGPFKYPTGMAEDVVNADAQLMTLRNFFLQYKEKILCAVTGNHDDWIYKTAGVEPYRWLVEDLNIPLLNSGGLLNLEVNGVKYKILLYHAISKYNSSFNPTHAGKRMLELHRDADIVVSGDKHRFGMEKLTHRDKKPYIIQLGTFKTEDSYGRRSYGMAPHPQAGFPVLFLSAGEKNVEAIENLEIAKDFIDLVNGG